MAQHLISIGADLSLRCKWTDMSALHYAAYFDVGPVLTTLLRKTKVRYAQFLQVCCFAIMALWDPIGK